MRKVYRKEVNRKVGFRKLGGYEKLPQLDLEAKGEGTESKVTYIESKQWQSTFDASKMVNSYIVTHEGEKKQFNGTTVLDRILAEAQPGDNLVITFLGTQPNKVRGKNPIKLFEVVVDDPDYNGDDREEETEDKVAKKKVPF